MLFYMTKFNNIATNTIFNNAWNFLPKWNSTQQRWQIKKPYRKSNGAGKYACNLLASKKSCFNKCNCKSGQHNRMRWKVSRLCLTSVYRKARKKIGIGDKKRKWDHLLYFVGLCRLLTRRTYAIILFSGNRITLIISVLTSLNNAFLVTFFQIPIRLTMWVHGRKLCNHLGNQGV